MDKAKVMKFVKDNWKFLVMSLLLIGGIGGVIKFQKGERFEIYVILPENAPDIFGDTDKVKLGEFSARSKMALRMAVRALNSQKTGDGDKLAELLKKIENNPDAFAKAEAAAQATPVGINPLVISIIVKVAIKVAIVILENRAPNTPSEWDDRLLALLKLFESNPRAIEAAHAAVVS